MNKDGFFFLRLFPLIMMLLVTIVCISIVTGLHLTTKDLVEANEQLYLRRAVLQAAHVDFPDNFQKTNAIYEQQVSVDTSGDRTVYIVERAEAPKAYVVPFMGAGLWGPIEVLVGFSENYQILTGIGILSQSETPGLGARIEEKWYLEQFNGKEGPFDMVEEGSADEKDEIDAITGATRTSEAMLSIMNHAVQIGPEVLEDM